LSRLRSSSGKAVDFVLAKEVKPYWVCPHPGPMFSGSPARNRKVALRATKSAPSGFVPGGAGVFEASSSVRLRSTEPTLATPSSRRGCCKSLTPSPYGGCRKSRVPSPFGGRPGWGRPNKSMACDFPSPNPLPLERAFATPSCGGRLGWGRSNNVLPPFLSRAHLASPVGGGTRTAAAVANPAASTRSEPHCPAY
jgi:hypothetical protein